MVKVYNFKVHIWSALCLPAFILLAGFVWVSASNFDTACAPKLFNPGLIQNAGYKLPASFLPGFSSRVKNAGLFSIAFPESGNHIPGCVSDISREDAPEHKHKNLLHGTLAYITPALRTHLTNGLFLLAEYNLNPGPTTIFRKKRYLHNGVMRI
ncbi:MAG: hypothetical protein V4543_00010 [Bacteroidota bacterium]